MLSLRLFYLVQVFSKIDFWEVVDTNVVKIYWKPKNPPLFPTIVISSIPLTVKRKVKQLSQNKRVRNASKISSPIKSEKFWIFG